MPDMSIQSKYMFKPKWRLLPKPLKNFLEILSAHKKCSVTLKIQAPVVI